MREIKFRAWSKVNNKIWIVRELLEPKDIAPQGTVKLDRINNPSDDGEVDISLVELMQFTGLKDKNGKDIYEGDIVRVYNYLNGKIWEGHCHNQSIVYQDNKFNFNHCWGGEELGKNSVEIIGNIYEHPELLK